MPHFYVSDLSALGIALPLGILFLLIPGYAIGWGLDLFGFRSSSNLTKWSLSLAIGPTIVPILLYIPLRLFGVRTMQATMTLLVIGGIFLCVRQNSFLRWNDIPKPAKLAALFWICLCICLMLDVAIGPRLYPSTVIIDTSFRSQVISSLANSPRLPAPSYFFHPGHDVPFRYHYVYFIVCALMVQAGNGFVTAAMALVSLTIWTGLSFFSVISIFCRFFWPLPNRNRAVAIAWALLAVGGLDLLPAGAAMIWRVLHGYQLFINPDIGLWNGMGAVFSWISTSVWSTHHIGGLVACVVGCTLLWESRDSLTRTRWTAAVGAGLAFATAAGSSVYVTTIFAAFLLVVLVELFLNSPTKAGPVMLSGILAVLFTLPFLMDVASSHSPHAPSLFHFAIRPFAPVILLYNTLGVQSSHAWNVGFLTSLPINYLFEFGIFLLGGIWWLLRRRTRSSELKYRDDLVIGLAAVSLIIPSFVWSGMEISNDLGFRGVLPAQFILLFCTAELVNTYWGIEVSCHHLRGFFLLALVFLAIGFGTTLLELFIVRGGIGTAPSNTILRGDTIREDTSAERFANLRMAYSWLRRNSARSVVIQENPETGQLVTLGQYSERRALVYGSNPSYMVGEDHRQYFETLERTRRLFAADSNIAEVASICGEYGLNYIVIQQGDPVWSDRASYGWRTNPVFSTNLVRIIPCYARQKSDN